VRNWFQQSASACVSRYCEGAWSSTKAQPLLLSESDKEEGVRALLDTVGLPVYTFKSSQPIA
jgi:hypothetical protein